MKTETGVIAAYANHCGIAKAIAQGWKDYADICEGAAENAGAEFERDTSEFVELFEMSLEGILSA